MSMRSKKQQIIPELLAPAGSFEKLVTAVHYGADAVYLGGQQFSLRARAANFDMDTLAQGIEYAHRHGVKVYVTVNIFAHNKDFSDLPTYLHNLEHLGADGLIVADPGVLDLALQLTPTLPVHLSTQANVTNGRSAAFWSRQGVKRINLARELGYREIRAIRQETTAEIELFVHGAVCISYSGRCMLSSYLTGRDANQGDCAHPCRYSYRLVEEKRPGEYYPVEEDHRGTYIFNARDLCLLQRLPQLLATGADSLKIEGRMKSMGYVGSVVRLYRTALDWIEEQLFLGAELEELRLPAVFAKEMKKIGTRGHSENFFDGHPSSADMLYDTMRVAQGYAPVGIVRSTHPLCIETRNVLQRDDWVEYLQPGTIAPVEVQVRKMIDRNGEEIDRANPGNRIQLHTEPALNDSQINSIFRKYISPQ